MIPSARRSLLIIALCRWLHPEVSIYGPVKTISGKRSQILFSLSTFFAAVPYQNNSWDCGVFVCRYAYGLFKTRNHKVYTEGDFSESFLAAITNSSEFSFDMGDIARIRVEFGTLIDRLSTSYKHWKEEKRKKDEKKDDDLKLVKEESAEGVSFV